MADSTNKAQNIKTAPGFDVNGAGAAFGNPNFTRQGIRAGATQFVKPVATAVAPAKAPAAPTGRTGYLFTGLAEALNTYQNDLVKKKIVSKADVYEFAFDPLELGACTVKKPGSTDRSKTAGKEATTAKQALDKNTDKVNNNSQNWSIEPGTQIIQVIDQIMRSSSLITDQALWQVDPVTQKIIPGKGTGLGQTVWYNITVDATMLEYDEKRRDYAYRMKFIITPYAITQMASEYFPDSKYRGSHKSFNYWFTGKNTQILSYEQTYNNLYRIVLSGEAATKIPILRDHRDQYTKIPMPTTEQKTGQQTGTYTNSAADSAADFLYSPGELAEIRMKILGDPAFLAQDIVATGVDNQTFKFSPFNRDGSINFNSSQVVFDIIWNQPDDYDLDTGVISPYRKSGRAKQYNAYILKTVKSHFSRGRFEQDIEANLLIEWETEAKPAEVRPAVKKPRVKPKPKADRFGPNDKVDFVGQLDPLGGTRDNPMSFAVNSFFSA